jgi:hypothetical protein
MHNVVYILTLLLTVSGTAVNFDSLPPLSGVRAMAWLTGSVQGTLFGYWLLCLFSCTFPAPLVPRVLKAAQLGLSQSPFPLFLPQVLFSL